MGNYLNTAKLIQNMEDAGCSETTISCFCDCIEQGNKKEGMSLLEKQREELLNEIHRSRSCMEFLKEVLLKIEEESKWQ